MELGFNIAWLVVALVLSLGWLRGTPDKSAQRSLFALMLLLMLLFPVISITDDIHHDYFNVTGEEVRYKEDLQQRLDFARQHWDAASLPVTVPPRLSGVPLATLTFERVEWEHHSPLTHSGFPPTVFDLPPPQLS
ncbi:MAG: hypothetical protein ACJ71N_04665 [Terriglobales bacterium]|jgi:hypothetical protein